MTVRGGMSAGERLRAQASRLSSAGVRHPPARAGRRAGLRASPRLPGGSDLASWDAADWANVKWGSIYHALRSLTRSGHLLDHDDVAGRTDYELTEHGEAEYLRLLRDAARHPHTRPDQLAAALAMLPSLPRDEAIGLLRERLAALQEIRDEAQARLDSWTDPPHWSELYGLWRHTAAGGVEWTAGLIGRLPDVRRAHSTAQ